MKGTKYNRDIIWFTRSVVGALLSLLALLPGVVMILAMGLFQLVFLPKDKWVNINSHIHIHRFKDSPGCMIICSLALFIVSCLADMQSKIEDEFCIRV